MPAPAAERRRDSTDHQDNPDASAVGSMDSLLDEVTRKEVPLASACVPAVCTRKRQQSSSRLASFSLRHKLWDGHTN